VRRNRPLRTRGSALLVTLAFVVLATITLLAFFLKAGSARWLAESPVIRAKSETLVRSAVEATIADLRLEMLAGAEASPTNAVASPLPPMTVRRPWAMVPAPVLSPNLPGSGFTNLVKQSLSGVPSYPGSADPATYQANGPAAAQGLARASAVNTSAASLNGRVLSAARWDRAILTDATLPATALPDWIYVTRQGVSEDGTALASQAVTDATLANPNYVVGRYAYNLYDVGGLLDLNAAGFPAAAAANEPGKGSLAWADLSAIGLSADQIASLTAFRNPQSSANFLTDVAYGSEYLGFLSPFKSGNASDGFFYTRQDLLRFFMSLYGDTTVSQFTAAQRVIIDSLAQDLRFLAAPSWNPPPLGSASRPPILAATAGGNNATGQDDQINPAVAPLQVLAGKTFTRLRYTDPQNFAGATEVPANAGDPFLLSRFPLDLLRLITRTATAQAGDPIYRYFGISRASTGASWVYNHGSAGSILTLQQVQSGAVGPAREPDMVELLKAAMLAGSVGKSAGTGSLGNKPSNAKDQTLDYQIIQVFANLIDQTTNTNYSTHLQFNGADFYGIKNLPYLTRVKCFLTRLLPDAQAFAAADPYALTYLPEIWNPHDPTLPAAADGPTQFRFTVDTATDIPVQTTVNNLPTTLAPVGFDRTLDYLTLTPKALAACTEPLMITQASLGTPSPEVALRLAPVDTGFVGVASVSFSTGIVPPAVIFYRYYTNSVAANAIVYALEYYDPLAGLWIPYSQHYVQSAGGESSTTASRGRSNFAAGSGGYYSHDSSHYVAFDPRTDRFSTYRNEESDTTGGAQTDNTPLRTSAGTNGYGFLTASNWMPSTLYQWTMGAANPSTGGQQAMATIEQNTAKSATRYLDPDGILRPGDGALNDGANPQGIMYISKNYPSRPIVLNRPFRAVAEMGYAFRDTPGRSLDFSSASSGDAALLDFFCINQVPATGLTSGRISANSRNVKAIESLLLGAQADPATQLPLANNRAGDAAAALVALTTGAGGPLLNRAELATRFMGAFPVSGTNERIKRQREVFVRALADATETRTWNLLVDLIAQTGKIVPNPQLSGAALLANFNVESERHIWVHLSIDRMTGRILNLNVEPVHE
jgi:hypothetical protein